MPAPSSRSPVRVVFSDLHFGDPDCSLQSKAVRDGLVSFLHGLGPVEEIVLAGDILDANISTLTEAIEGKATRAAPQRVGLRIWLALVLRARGLEKTRIVYVPGNHDYIIWNLLSTDAAFMQRLARGETLEGLPMTEGFFGEPFLRGVAPRSHRDRLVVTYPDYQVGHADRRVLVTHGHYLDKTQSLFKRLDRLIAEEGDVRRAVRKFFVITAQYQAVANAVSYTPETRELVDRLHKGLSRASTMGGRLRGTRIGPKVVDAIELYLVHFRELGRNARPGIFVFGHTHEPGSVLSSAFGTQRKHRLIDRTFEIHNTGSFVAKRDAERKGSFLVLDDGSRTGRIATLYGVDGKGAVRPLAAQLARPRE